MIKLVRKFYPDPDAQGGAGAEPEKSGKKPDSADNVELAKALKETRENSVSKAEYEKLKEENRRLVSEIINGEGAGNGQSPAPEQPADIVKLKEELFGSKSDELSNLEFWQKTLQLRDAVIKKGEPDPFLPVGAKITPDENDVDCANRVAEVVQECIKEAEGNSEVFTALLQSRTNNDSPSMTMHLKKLGIKFK